MASSTLFFFAHHCTITCCSVNKILYFNTIHIVNYGFHRPLSIYLLFHFLRSHCCSAYCGCCLFFFWYLFSVIFALICLYVFLFMLGIIGLRKRTDSSNGKEQIKLEHSLKNASNKKKSKFLKFDIVDIFPSITEELMLDSPNFAERYTNISKYQMTTIIHARKFVLFHNGDVWKKKSNQSTFDVSTRSFDSAWTFFQLCIRCTHSEFIAFISSFLYDGQQMLIN